MFAPVRAITSYRPNSSVGVLVAVAVTTAVFSATPFLIPSVAEQLGVGLGIAGIISTAQVGGFAVASLTAGRRLSPSRRILVVAAISLAVVNVASGFAPNLTWLAGLRVLAGVAMGVTTWVGWSEGSRQERGIAEVAAVGPIVAVIGSPLLATLADVGGYRLVYLSLAVVALAPIVTPIRVETASRIGGAVSDSRSNRVLLAALVLLTFSGSALFVFCAAIGARTGLSPLAVSSSFSLNALAGLVATRLNSRHPGRWLLFTSGAALLTGLAGTPWAFVAGMAAWGFGFWMAVPSVMAMLAARSLRPDERMGDAQSFMAFGRMLGPAAGGMILGEGRFATLAVMASAVMGASAVTVEAVERGRAAQRARTP